MSNQLVTQIIDFVNHVNWPTLGSITPQSQRIYEQGLDRLMLYRGDPKVLLAALKIFSETNSLPYAYAGVAATLMSASYDHGDVYDQTGLALARIWLEKAQSYEAHRLEINCLEADLYVREKQYSHARLILDYFQQNRLQSFQVCRIEMEYWSGVRNLAEVERWFERSMQCALTPAHQTDALHHIAGCYLRNQNLPKALAFYKKIEKLSPQDPWLWHNMSIIYFRLKRYDKARRYNQKALSLMEFLAARNVEKDLKAVPRARGFNKWYQFFLLSLIFGLLTIVAYTQVQQIEASGIIRVRTSVVGAIFTAVFVALYKLAGIWGVVAVPFCASVCMFLVGGIKLAVEFIMDE